jgi:L-threonylcarbamoyladenylate synthase
MVRNIKFMKNNLNILMDDAAAACLSSGGIGVLPTDTIYGIVGSALNKKAVERIYRLRKRDLKKPMIILIGDINDLKLFGIMPDSEIKKIFKKLWPGKVSIILPCPLRKFSYLHRGANALAFRMPKPERLRGFLKKTGPLVAPSANFEGEPPARMVKEAQKYFKDNVAFYCDAGRLESAPSTLIKIEDGKVIVLRSGAGRVK